MEKRYYIRFILAAAIMGIIARGPYRDFIYSNGYNDLGVADSLPNFFLSIVAGLVAYLIIRKKYIVWVIVAVSLLWEIDQRFTLTPSLYTVRVFDHKDMIAALFGGVVAYYIIGKTETKLSNKII